MSKKESRMNQNKEKQSGNIFYWIIGALTIILLSLIIFVFIRSGKKKDTIENEPDSALVEENGGSESEQDNQDDEKSNQNDQTDETNDSESDKDNTEDEEDEDDKRENDDSIQPGESEVVNEDSPYDSSHVVNFNEGSKDRVAIKNKVMTTTGLDSNLIEWWVGNNGPGKVEATVSDSEKKEIYKVYLQYGDGDWNVTNYERLDKLPE